MCRGQTQKRVTLGLMYENTDTEKTFRHLTHKPYLNIYFALEKEQILYIK